MKLSPFEVTARFVRACYPVTIAEIEWELRTQCTFTNTQEDSQRQAREAVADGIRLGIFEIFDGNADNITLVGTVPADVPPPPMDRLRREVRDVFALQAETVAPARTAASGYQRLMWDILHGGAR